MTSRDVDIIDFLHEYKVATTTIISHFFFPSSNACRKALTRLYRENRVKRVRMLEGSQNSEYIYYTNKLPQQMKHMLKIMEFYYKWDSKYKVEEFHVQKKYGEIIPDGELIMENGDIILLEVELSHKGFDYLKYEKFYQSGQYKEFFQKMPEIIIYGNEKITIPYNTKCNFKILV